MKKSVGPSPRMTLNQAIEEVYKGRQGRRIKRESAVDHYLCFMKCALISYLRSQGKSVFPAAGWKGMKAVKKRLFAKRVKNY